MRDNNAYDSFTGNDAVDSYLGGVQRDWERMRKQEVSKHDADWFKTIVGVLAFSFCIIVLTLSVAGCIALWRWIV